MKKYSYFIGIDVSKCTLDLSIVVQNRELIHLKINNELSDIKKALEQIKEQYPDFDWTTTLFCLEPTGIYNVPIMSYLVSKQANIWLQSARQIQCSMGQQRGKTDRLDARLLARYALTHHCQAQLWQPTRQVVEELRVLLRLRERLKLTQQQLLVPLNELKEMTLSAIAKESTKLCKASLKAIKADIGKTELAIKQLIKGDEELQRMITLMTSINGVGELTACEVILTTNEFKDIDDARKYACYAGVAPFEHSSGKKQSRAKVSHIANKKVKRLLHLAAMAAIRSNKDLKAYYERKVQEGKNKMLVLNAIRNKLIHRIFACVKNNRPYVDTYLTTMA